MRNQMSAGVIAMLGLAVWAVVSSAQTSGASPRDALVDVLVWGAYLKIDPNAYSPAVKAEVERLLRRSEAYRSTRRVPTGSREQGMGYAAQVRYERRLVALSDAPEAQTLAVAYVDSLQPCYEWERGHDCPEREALFATEYQAAHQGGPFSAYLPLLAAHRWLCTAEAYEYGKRPGDAARSRGAYEEALSIARRSTDLLIRTAAEGLTARGRCSSPR